MPTDEEFRQEKEPCWHNMIQSLSPGMLICSMCKAVEVLGACDHDWEPVEIIYSGPPGVEHDECTKCGHRRAVKYDWGLGKVYINEKLLAQQGQSTHGTER